MKIILSFTTILLLLQFISCTKDSNSNMTAVTGQWVIHYYWDEKDETSDFSGYIFEFMTNSQVKATKAGTTVTGTWQETSGKFILDFGTDPILQEINDDWKKITKTSTLIHLEDDNPAQDDELHFVRL